MFLINTITPYSKKSAYLWLLSLMLWSSIAQAQITLYSEDFTGQAGQGAIGPGGTSPTIDLSAVDWTIDVSNANFADDRDFFYVRTVSGNQLFEGRDLDTEARWLSPSIDISGYINVGFSMLISESNGTGGDNLEDTDTVVIEYRVDGGTWTQAATNGSFSNDYDPTTTSQTGLSGSTLELRATMTNNGGGERMRLDDIVVTGSADCPAVGLPFTESFEGGTFPPDCWNAFRGTNGLGTNFDWTRSTSSANTGSASAFVRYEVVSGGNAEDWLVTPGIDLGTGQAQLSFFGRDQYTGDWNTEYSVRISTTSPTDIASFTTLATYDETEMGNTFSQKTVDLSSYSGVVYLAFVMEQNDGDNWFLDDITVEDISGCTTPASVSALNTTFVDNSIALSWTLGDCYDEILVVAKNGSAVTATPSGDGSSYTADANFGSGTEIVTDEFIVFNDTGTSVNIANVIFGDTYHFEVFARKGSNWSAGVATSFTVDYCGVGGTTTYDTSITLVDFVDINNVTAQGSGYDDFTAQSTEVTRGGTEDLTVHLNTDGNYNVYSYVWIDWNQDGDFDDLNETYDMGLTSNSPDGPTSNSPLAIAIPEAALLGDTRMRVWSQYYSGLIPPSNPCGNSSDGEIEDYTVTVVESTDYTYNDGWTPANPNGVSTSGDAIIITSGDAMIDSDTTIKTMTVTPTGSLTVNSGVTLTVIDTLTLQSHSSNYSSLIRNGSITGTLRYERFTNVMGSGSTGGNDLISPPLDGQRFDAFATANSGVLAASGDLRAFAPFDNAGNPGAYVNYDVVSNASTILASGTGYRAATTGGAPLVFEGNDLNTTVTVAVSHHSGISGEWNLIGNPYPCYINLDAFLNHEVSPGVTNMSLLSANSGVYGYDGNHADGWDIVNLANAGVRRLAPGQAFFVSVDSNATLEFTPEMRMTGHYDDFIPGRQAGPTYLKLELRAQHDAYVTDIYFNDRASRALDAGYDSKTWGALSNDFSLYSHLVEGHTGVPIALQSLHPEDLSEVTIPLGVHASAGRQLTFGLKEKSLPDGVKVYLEDRLKQRFTDITEDTYVLTLQNASSGAGRFFLKISSNTLSTSPAMANNDLLIFSARGSQKITVSGLLEQAAQLQLYDMHGRLVKRSHLAAQRSQQTVATHDLQHGAYVVVISNHNRQQTQKIIIH